MSATIVIIDDTQTNLVLLANLLQEAGYDVRVANSGLRGQSLIERQPPDIVFLDINLPDKDGYAICADLRKNEATRTLPIFFLSAHDNDEARAKAKQAGGDEYLLKPFEAGEILSRVALHLRVGAAEKAAAATRAELAQLKERVQDLAARSGDPDPSRRPTTDDWAALTKS